MDAGEGLLRGYVESDARVDRLRRANRQKALQAELERENAAIEEEIHARRRLRASQREAALADELQRKRIEDLRREKTVQRVREQAPELRELESKLQAALVSKERDAQMAESKNNALRERELDLDFGRQQERSLAEAAKAEAEQAQMKKAQIGQHKDTLQKQMREREAESVLAYQQFLQEKAQIDAVVAHVQERELQDALLKLEKQRAARSLHESFLEQRERQKQQEKEQQELEEKRILQYMQEQNKRTETNLKLKREKEAAKERVLQEQSRKMAEEQQRKDELDALIADFHIEQEHAKQVEMQRLEQERRAQERQKMFEANEQQKKLKAELREREAEEEKEFRRKMMEKFAEDDRLDEQNRQRRNQLKVEHAKKVQELIDEKRRLREEDLKREQELEQMAKQREAERQAIIEEERKRLLMEHAAKLTGFIPKGLAATEEERAILLEGLGRARNGGTTSM